jgi:hypothetical protein
LPGSDDLFLPPLEPSHDMLMHEPGGGIDSGELGGQSLLFVR